MDIIGKKFWRQNRNIFKKWCTANILEYTINGVLSTNDDIVVKTLTSMIPDQKVLLQLLSECETILRIL